ncbi:MAG: alanine racemase [candidate division Zixibacteria bacterium]|jgi:D-serine deaminase-like pyridoxal phosphate-dependent protein|nr:alanine racemase [candidate division Zixibacteria bacterium]
MVVSVQDLDTPCLLIDQQRLAVNIARMQALADRHGVKLRPHIKTHKMPVLALTQIEAGAIGVAVATLGEAETMAAAGITNIQIASQVVGAAKYHRLAHLRRQITLSCAVDSIDHVRELSAFFATQGLTLELLIEVDTGLHRCGVADVDAALALAREIERLPALRFRGVMTHAGHAYAAVGPDDVARIGREEGERMVALAEQLRASGLTVDTVSVGSTPTARHAAAVAGVTELRVGNYIFNDMMQVSLGSASLDQCAMSVLSTVISTPTADRAVIDAGAKALALDRGAHGNSTLHGYGLVREKDCTISRLSEEHGIIDECGGCFVRGEKVSIIPNHACAVVNLFDYAYLVDGGTVVDTLPVTARGRA